VGREGSGGIVRHLLGNLDDGFEYILSLSLYIRM